MRHRPGAERGSDANPNASETGRLDVYASRFTDEADDADALLLRLQRTLMPVRHRGNRSHRLWIVYLSGFAAFTALCFLPLGPRLPVVATLAVATIVGIYELVKLLLTGENIAAQEAQGVVRRLAEIGDVRAVGPLLDADVVSLLDLPIWSQRAETDVAALKAEVRKALVRLLPQIGDEDRSVLTDQQVQKLHWYLDSLARVVKQSEALPTWTAYPGITGPPGLDFPVSEIPDSFIDFLIDLMRALEHIGRPTSIPCLERIANLGVPAPNLIRLQEAADTSLLVLKERLERERTGKTLLRPAADPPMQEPPLLRPAQGKPVTGAEQLLRPADRE